MRIYLSAVFDNVICKQENVEELLKDTHILHSFAYMNPKYVPFYTMCKSFLMDSGAFTVMNSKKGKNSFEPMDFTKKYAKHIKENKIFSPVTAKYIPSIANPNPI